MADYSRERIKITVLYPLLHIQPPRSMKQTRKLSLLQFRWGPFQMTSITECIADCELQCTVILSSLAHRCNLSPVKIHSLLFKQVCCFLLILGSCYQNFLGHIGKIRSKWSNQVAKHKKPKNNTHDASFSLPQQNWAKPKIIKGKHITVLGKNHNPLVNVNTGLVKWLH